MADTDKQIFPRIPERNWWTLRDQFAKTLPKEVSIGYLKTLLQLDTEKAARNLLPPLKQLGLIDENGRPTDLANEWRNDTQYARTCEKMLEIYPQDLRDLYGDPDVDKSLVDNWFQYTGKLGQGTARLSAAFYLLLLDRTPKSSADFAKPKTTVKPKREKSTKVDTPKPSSDSISNPIDTSEPSQTKSLPPIGVVDEENQNDWFSLHIDLQIHISPEANSEQIDQIFASMAKHIMSMKRAKQDTDETN